MSVQAGGYQTYGPTGRSLPNDGAHRIAQLNSLSTLIWLSLRAAGINYAAISFDDSGNMMVGGTYDQLNSSAGITNPLQAYALFANFLDQYCPHIDERTLDGTIVRNKRNEHKATSDATPTTINVPTPTNVGVYRRVVLTASSASGAAVWIWEKTPSSVNLVTYDFLGGTSGTWTASWSGGSTIAITGAAA